MLANQGVELETKTIRLIAYRYAARARLEQQIESTAFEDRVSGRRVVMSSDGGRLRLRETKRGPKTTKGRQRYTGAWREPKGVFHQRLKVVDSLWVSTAVSRDEGRVHPLGKRSLNPGQCASKVGSLGGFSIHG